MTTFRRLNADWNAEPNAPKPRVEMDGRDVVVSFGMNPFVFPEFTAEDVGRLRFSSCSRYRLGSTNDEGWHRGQCRFSKIAPSWGEFYEVSGDLRLAECPADWVEVGTPSSDLRHFLFYFRDEEFECDASDWRLEVWRPEAALEPTAVGAGSSANAGNVIFRRGSAFGRLVSVRMTSTILNKFEGTWCSKDSVVEYSFSFHGDPIVVTGIDTQDGEELRIQDVTFDGSELRFTSICPSTSFALRHVFRSVFGNEIEHEYTRIENWQRRKT